MSFLKLFRVSASSETVGATRAMPKRIRNPSSIKVNHIETEQELYEGLGCLKDFEYELEFEDNPIFEAKPVRCIPHAIRNQVKEAIDEMVKIGVIKKVESPTPVVSNLVIAKQKGKLRVCLDPSDVNKYIKRRHFPLKSIEEISSRIRNSQFFTILDLKKGFWQIKISEKSQQYLTF